MRLTTKDTVGLVLVGGTLAALVAHNAPLGHMDSHVSPVADAGGAVTYAVGGEQVTAFYDVNVLPMDGDRVMRHRVVVVEGAFITRIEEKDALELPERVQRINGRGELFLAPGLTDAHVHLGDEPEALLPLFLANGVTTVFNLRGSRRHLDLRERILAGEIRGPTIYTAGPYIDGSYVRSAAEAARVVERQKADGYDFVKVHGDLTEEAFGSLMSASKRAGIAVIGHAQRSLPISTVVQSGQVAITHAEDLIYTDFVHFDESELSGVADAMADAGTWLIPVLVNFEAIASQWGQPEGLRAVLDSERAQYVPASLLREWEASNDYVGMDPDERWQIARMLEFHGPLIRAFHEAGVPLLAGTDAGMPGVVPGFALPDEIVALGHVGLSHYETLVTATRNAGRFISDHVDRAASFGTVHVGARADLVLLRSDPREDLEALLQPEGVMVRGHYYDGAELRALIEEERAPRR